MALTTPVTDFSASYGHEPGLPYLSASYWLPPPCDPGYVLSEIRTRSVDACKGRMVGSTLVLSNVVERLAISYALLMQGVTHPHLRFPMWENLEALGNEVSPEFAECGPDAILCMTVIHDLSNGRAVDPLQKELALRAIGRLWCAALSGPPGYEQFITRSASGDVPLEYNFFESPPMAGMTGSMFGQHLLRLIDLLHAAIALKDLPSSRVGPVYRLREWSQPVCRIVSGRGSHKPAPLIVHSKRTSLRPGVERLDVRLEDSANGESIGSGRLVVLHGRTGMFEDFVDLSSHLGGQVEAIVRGVFAANDVVNLNPRVRRLLDLAENQVFQLVVMESLYLTSAWRGGTVGMRLFRQMLVECDASDLVLTRLNAFVPQDASGDLPFGVQAAYAAAKLRLASRWHDAGADYLFNGIMGMALPTINNARTQGLNERLPSAAG